MDKAKETLKKNTMLLALIVVVIFFTINTDGKLLLPRNITMLIAQNSYVVILAVGVLMCIIAGGHIDLSIGSVVALIGAIAGKLIVTYQVNIWIVMPICLIIGALIGAWHGFWIAYIRIPAFIVTLAGMLLWRGVALVVLNGKTIGPFPDSFLNLFNSYIPDVFQGQINIMCIVIGVVSAAVLSAQLLLRRMMKGRKGYQQEKLFNTLLKAILLSAVIIMVSYKLAQFQGLPAILILLAVVVGVYTYITLKTVPGRYLYAMGGNEKAAKLSGINTNKMLFVTYINMSFLCALGALVCVARFNSAAPTAGVNYELDAIGASFIGGASAYGGIGTVPGAVIGAIFMGVLNNGMSIMGIDSNKKMIVKGIVLLSAVAFDVISKKRRRSA